MKILSKLIRDIPDFPKKGIIFKDITPLLKDAKGFRKSVDKIASKFARANIDYVLSVEARGFIFGAAVAYKLGAGLIPVRKKGKLPFLTHRVTYELEYGTDTLEIHQDAITAGSRILIVDDLLATGGTAAGVVKLIEQLKGKVVGAAFLIELKFLKGREKLKGQKVVSLIKY